MRADRERSANYSNEFLIFKHLDRDENPHKKGKVCKVKENQIVITITLNSTECTSFILGKKLKKIASHVFICY